MSKKLIAIAAMASNGVIGNNNALPWHYPEDLKFFKETTLGKTVLMGKKTFQSILLQLNKPLPKRRNIVMTTTMSKDNPYNVEIVKSLDELPDEEVYLIGGAKMYEQFLPKCDELLLTLIYKHYDGDTRFPQIRFPKFEVLRKTDDFEIRKYTR